ncbi:MAG: hypothetical protein VB095_07560 [Anaerovorax sp.]|nr:hypothetical protein [Anaerovorax sp.]
MLWQDEYTCNNLLKSKTDLIIKLSKEEKVALEVQIKKCNKNIEYWLDLLVKQYIYNNTTDKSIEHIQENFITMVEKGTLKDYINELLPDINENDVRKTINNVNKTIENIAMEKTSRIFFNNKPVIIYKSEIEAIKDAGTKYAQYKNSRKQPSEWAQKYLFVFLVWQKAYQNMYGNKFEWALDKEETLRELTEKSGDSGQRCRRFEKLIKDGYITYEIKNVLNLRKEEPQLLYKMNFLANEGEEAFQITDFKYIWEHYIVYNNNIKYGFCSECGEFIKKNHKDKKLCEACQKK